MKTECFVAALLAVLLLCAVPGAAWAGDQATTAGPLPLPVLDDKPIPQLDAGGPSAAVTSLAFSADGDSLYAAGLDKVVRLWTIQKGSYVLKTTYRVPMGPGNMGAVNAIALSPDGKWLAIAGRAPIRGEAGFRRAGVIVGTEALSSEQNRDAGVIYVVNTANPAGGKVLRGHRGEVRALAFAPAREGKPPLLVSAAFERDGDRRFGGLRLWDVDTGKSLAERADLPATKARPGLAIWHTGPGTTELRVAIAWQEDDEKKPSYLRLWDTSPGAVARQGWEDDRATQTVALLGQNGGATLLTGGFEPNKAGRLLVWNLSADRPARARFNGKILFPTRNQVRFLPVGLSLVSAQGSAPTHAAVVLLPFGGRSSAGADFRLALVDLRTNRIAADVPVPGSDKTHLPAIAARGGQLAVAATRDHAIRLYAVTDLLGGKAEPKAVFASDGLSPRQVAFVDKGHGLWLREEAERRPGVPGKALSGGLVFDLDKRSLRANQGNAVTDDSPALGEWSRVVDADRKTVRVRQGQNNLPPVHLSGKDQEITAVELRPPAPGRPAVLAVAYTERDAEQTVIMLCDPANGKPYRHLVGHLQRVNQLAFSASRPLLASVADDQTICVWSLADLDQAVGQVLGLTVSEDSKRVVVRAVKPGSPAAMTRLAAGDVLETMTAPGGKATPIQNAADFLLTISARRPGDQVEVTVAGKGAVKLPVGRGVDERKPLFSLFLLRDRALPGWIGWSPTGPYDYSSPAAEKHLGWQTNTGNPASPVSYAAAGEYRKGYYREGILRYLAAEADLGRALQKWNEDHPVRSPQAALRFLRPDGAQPTERADTFLVRKAVNIVRVGINQDYPVNDKHVLRWRLTRRDGTPIKGDAGEISGQATRDGQGWRANLSAVEWRRGEYQVRVGLSAHAGGPELASEMLALRFQPPAPAVALRLDGKAVRTTELKPLQIIKDKLALQIELQARAGQKVEMRFGQRLNGLPRHDIPSPEVRTAGLFPLEFRLQEGLNHITVRAINQGALAGHEAAESAGAEVWVSYKAPHELPPRFTALRLDPQPEVKQQDGKEVWVVDRPAIRLTGKIEAAGILAKAEWSAGGTPLWRGLQTVPPSGPHDGRTLDFAVDLKLKAGQLVPLRLRAKSQHSHENTVEHGVLFWPPLPNIAIDPLSSQDLLTEKVTLTGTFQAATPDPFEVVFRVASSQGKVKSFKPELDLKAQKWKVELSLFPGANRVETLIANKWRGEHAVEGVLPLRYRRPPQITAFPKTVDAVETNKIRLTVAVEGPADRPLTAMRAGLSPVPFEAGKPELHDGRWIWKMVELPEVFVNDGDHNLDKVSIRAVTDEGESEPAVVHVVHKKLPRLPQARYLSPVADTARRPEYTAAFRVESERPLQRVEIRRGHELLYRADRNRVEQEGSRYVLQDSARLQLHNGVNRLELVAVNTDGRSPRAEAVISYTEPAVLVSLDQVELLGDNGVEQILKPVNRPNGAVTFPEVPRSLVFLAGRVRWSDPTAKALDDRGLEVVAKVGDCRQFPVALGPRGSGREANVRRFHVPLVLIGPKNRITIELPSLGQEELSRREFELACAAPEKKQRLHLLIVGVDVQDAEGLKNRVLDALAADSKDRPRTAQGEFIKKPPFDWCYLYHVLAGDVTRGQVEAQIVEINNEILRLKDTEGWLNDVVLIYYQGEDVMVPAKRERWLKTSLNYRFAQAPVEQFAIPCHALPRVPGVELLLLNVASTSDAVVSGSDWGGDPDAGFLRYACPDSAEVRSAHPALLSLLQEAIRKKGRLGEVVQYVNDLLGRQLVGSRPLVAHLDEDQARRRISEP